MQHRTCNATQDVFMKNKKLNKVWSKRHLPEDLWPLILCRLPVKCLLRYRCVSKSWLSLIGDPDFARLHLKNFKNNCHETHLFVVQGKKQQCIVRRSDTFKTNSAKLLTLGQRYNDGSWRFVCSMDGLVMLKRINFGPSRLTDLNLWNPSIRKLHEFRPLPIETSPNISLMDAEIGLGYDPLLKDYKYVKLIFVDSDILILHSVAVYTLGAASWKMIPFQGKGCSNWLWEPEFYDMEAVYFRGSLYFIGHDNYRRITDLVSFDLSSEVFSSTSCPGEFYFKQGDYEDYRVALIDGGCTLAVSNFDSCMWVLEKSCSGEGESVCWTRRYKFDLNVVDFLYIKKNSDLVMQWRHQEVSFRLANCKDMKQRWDLVMTYNLETEKEKILLQNKHGILQIHNVRGYVESLILLK